MLAMVRAAHDDHIGGAVAEILQSGCERDADDSTVADGTRERSDGITGVDDERVARHTSVPRGGDDAGVSHVEHVGNRRLGF